jgi:hypothetical protein
MWDEIQDMPGEIFDIPDNQMTFVEALIASGYELDSSFDDDCYVKQDADNFIHIYQQHEDEGLWNYVKMTDEFDVITEVTFDPNVDTIIN